VRLISTQTNDMKKSYWDVGEKKIGNKFSCTVLTISPTVFLPSLLMDISKKKKKAFAYKISLLCGKFQLGRGFFWGLFCFLTQGPNAEKQALLSTESCTQLQKLATYKRDFQGKNSNETKHVIKNRLKSTVNRLLKMNFLSLINLTGNLQHHH
jgi:hypothetical protein